MYRNTLSLILLACLSLPAHAVLSVERIIISSGTLEVTDPQGYSFGMLELAPGSAATADDGLFNGVIDADGHHGSPSNPVVTTTFLGVPTYGYFAHSAVTCNADCSALVTVLDPDPGAISMSGPWGPAISADFSGFFVDFNGNHILQGGTAAGTWSNLALMDDGSATFDFTLYWSAYNAQGPFLGMTGHWTLTGTAVMAVPETETWGLMVAGLSLVGAATRRRRSRLGEYRSDVRSAASR